MSASTFDAHAATAILSSLLVVAIGDGGIMSSFKGSVVGGNADNNTSSGGGVNNSTNNTSSGGSELDKKNYN